MSFTFYKQLSIMDCGPTCLRMIAKHYGKHYNADSIRQLTGFGRDGVSMLGISRTAEKIGLRTRGSQISFKMLDEVPHPAILHWNQNHFVVLISLKKNAVKIADPSVGIITYTQQEFLTHWLSSKNDLDEKVGTALLLEPSPIFYEKEGEKEHKLNWELFLQYFKQSKQQIGQVFLALGITFLIQLAFPFLTQSVVDNGINARNMQYITLVLIAQLMLSFSSTIVGFISSRIQIRISNIINISILSDFWIKLTRLPISYFDSHRVGDIFQRLGDNRQIQGFITGVALNTVFSVLNFLVYSVILIIYSVKLFIVFMVGNILYLLWVRLFLPIRRKINYETFHISASENNATLQMVQGMQEMRLNNAEQLKRWEWENIQAKIFKLNFKSLNYSQWQSVGGLFINHGKEIVITFIVASLVIEGQLTFGAMLAVQYIIGQLGGPINDFIRLVQNFQDAKISMERLNEVHQVKDEEPHGAFFLTQLPSDKSISIKDLSFSYPGKETQPVLDNINLTIPDGKVTAIVGVSGSGKTTLLKLLIKIYDQYKGEIKIGESNFKFISPSFWRSQCGTVLQDGYMFNDTIARNICVGDESIDYETLINCCKTTNILSFIETLPNGMNTQLGTDGIGVSQGQKQRILIARALYKNPQFLFFDEATNALDANNEKSIVEKLSHFFTDKTVIVVAHRLSTVKNADKIVVLYKGKIVEEGTHSSLVALKGHYYELVENQLELGN